MAQAFEEPPGNRSVKSRLGTQHHVTRVVTADGRVTGLPQGGPTRQGDGLQLQTMLWKRSVIRRAFRDTLPNERDRDRSVRAVEPRVIKRGETVVSERLRGARRGPG